MHLPGIHSFFKNLFVALLVAQDERISDNFLTLFVVACQNYKSFMGLSFGNMAKSDDKASYDGTVTLCEGCPVYILAIQKDLKIKNNSKSDMDRFDGRTMTVVHLYHAYWYKLIDWIFSFTTRWSWLQFLFKIRTIFLYLLLFYTFQISSDPQSINQFIARLDKLKFKRSIKVIKRLLIYCLNLL